MKNTLTKGMTWFSAAIFVVAAVMMMAGAELAQSGNACVYANDDVDFVNGPNTVDGYHVAATSQTYISPFQTGGESRGLSDISDIVFNQTKDILYASDSHSGDIAAMRVNEANCELTPFGNFPVGGSDGGGIGLAVSSDGKWLYAAGVKSAKLNVLAVRNDGSLTGVLQKVPLLNRPSSLAVSPDGATLIVAVPARPKTSNEVISYSINPSTGMLTQVSLVPPKGDLGTISIDSQSKFVYVNEPNDAQVRIGLLEIGIGSTLTFVRTYNFTEVKGSISLASTLLSANGKYLYVTNPNIASVTTLAVNSVTGALKYITTTSDGTMNEDGPVGLATTRNGAYVFTGEPDTGYIPYMGIFAVGSGGSLTSLGTFPISETYPAWVAAKAF